MFKAKELPSRVVRTSMPSAGAVGACVNVFVPALALAANRYRFLFDCATTLPASVLVTGDDFRLSKARDALSSVFAPVCAGLPAWRRAEPASVFWIALDEPLPNVLPATVATRDDVCLLLLAMLNSRPKTCNGGAA